MTRPELAPLIPGDPRMDQMPKGTLSTSRRPDGRLEIEHADPQVLFSAELVDVIVCGEWLPEVTIEVHGRPGSAPDCWLGSVIRIPGADRTVVYVLTRYADFCRGYIAEWPD